MPKFKKFKAFSLIEILITVALIVILATITIIALNPAQNFEDARDAQRSSHVAAILDAVTQFNVNQDTTPVTIALPDCETATDAEMAILTEGSTLAEGVDLNTPLVEDYMVELPNDPSNDNADITGYQICATTGGRIEVTAPLTEGDGADITVKR
jgi:prepilin-type N-terminal cleavage/methylation domain-containing protein